MRFLVQESPSRGERAVTPLRISGFALPFQGDLAVAQLSYHSMNMIAAAKEIMPNALPRPCTLLPADTVTGVGVVWGGFVD